MSDEPAASQRDDDIDPGKPVAVLADFTFDPSPTFLSRMRRAIQRRSAVSQLVSFSWNVPGLVLKEILELLVGLFAPTGRRKDDHR